MVEPTQLKDMLVKNWESAIFPSFFFGVENIKKIWKFRRLESHDIFLGVVTHFCQHSIPLPTPVGLLRSESSDLAKAILFCYFESETFLAEIGAGIIYQMFSKYKTIDKTILEHFGSSTCFFFGVF